MAFKVFEAVLPLQTMECFTKTAYQNLSSSIKFLLPIQKDFASHNHMKQEMASLKISTVRESHK